MENNNVSFNETAIPMVELKDGARLIQKDYRIDSTEYLPNRVRVREDIVKKDGFIYFVNRYKQEGTTVFYNTNQVKAVFNYPTPSKPDYADSTAVLCLYKTDQYDALSNSSASESSQKRFIYLLKTLAPYITSMNAADAIVLAQNLKAVKEVQSVNTNLNKTILQSHTVGSISNVEIPKTITFKIPVFKADTSFLVSFDVEIFIEAGDKGFAIELKCWNFDEVVEEAAETFVNGIVEQITDVPSYFCS